MHKFISFLFFLTATVISKAQVIGTTTQNFGGTIKSAYYNPVAINPAFTGEVGPFAITGYFGNQLNGSLIPNQVEQTVVLDGQLYNNAGLAFSMYRTAANNFNRNSYVLNYSKGQTIGDLNLKFGANIGLEVLPNIAVVGSSSQRTAMYGGVGLLSAYKGVVFGVALPTLLASSKYTFSKTTNFNLGYIYQNEESILSASAYVLLMRDFNNSNQSIDFNFKTIFNDRVGLGIYGRNMNANRIYGNKVLIPYLDYKISQTTNVGLSYDAQLLGISDYSGLSARGVFQLMFRYNNIAPDTKSKFTHY